MSESIEAGVRFRNLQAFGGNPSLSTTAFHTHDDDFIAQTVVRGTGVPWVDPLIYQYVSLTEVKIGDLEARGDIGGDNGVSAIIAASFADGDQETDGARGKLTEALAEESKATIITVNAVLPSIIDMPANRADMGDADFSTWVQPTELAEVMLFLASDAASAVTGALLPVKGRV